MALIGVLPDFTISAAGAATATVPAGSLAAYSLTVGALNPPFTGVVTLTASGLPHGATAVFSPVQVVPGAGSATVTVSVQTLAPQASMPPGLTGGRGVLWASVGLLCCLRGAGRRRRRLLALCCCALIFFTGCGARTVGEAANASVSQTFAVQLTGTSTNLAGDVVTHATGVTLIVQN